MRRFLRFGGVCICIALAGAATDADHSSFHKRESGSLCADSTASTTVSLTFFRSLGTSTDPEDTLVRNRASLPSVTADDVTYVADTILCRRAAEGIRHAIYNADTGVLASVELYQYGATRYLGDWPVKLGEFGGTAVLDTTFHVVGGIAH